MSARRPDMHCLQEVIRLHRMGKSARGIAQQLRMGRTTVRQYLDAFRKDGLLDGCPAELPETAAIKTLVAARFPAKKVAQSSSSVERWRPLIEKKVASGIGPTPIHDYLRLHEAEYKGGLSSIKRLCARIKRERGPSEDDVAIPVDTSPGEVAQVDFGSVGKIYDPEQGVLRSAYVFVMTLGHSRLMFCDIVFDQKIQTWLELHVRAFEFLGGVPRVVVPDNLKAAVIRAAFGVDDQAVLNRSYRELARHYGFQIDPTPPRSPQKKGKVERDVRYVKGSFFATWDSIDIDEDRKQLRRWIDEVANKRRHGTTSRVPAEVFGEEELSTLIPLPSHEWATVVWKKATLHRDSHVQVDHAFYSAPWRLISKQLWVRCTPGFVEIYHEDEHLCTHATVPRGKRSTIESHLPEQRRELRHRSQEYWVSRAKTIGPEVEALAQAIFDSDDVLLQLRRVQAVVTHLATFPTKRACRAAERALHFGSLEYGAIKSILSKGLDLDPLPEKETRDWSRNSRFARKPTDVALSLAE